MKTVEITLRLRVQEYQYVEHWIPDTIYNMLESGEVLEAYFVKEVSENSQHD